MDVYAIKYELKINHNMLFNNNKNNAFDILLDIKVAKGIYYYYY